MSHYLLYEVCIIFLKWLHPNSTLEKLKENTEVLHQFFGDPNYGKDPDYGKGMISDFDDDEWEDIDVGEDESVFLGLQVAVCNSLGVVSIGMKV